MKIGEKAKFTLKPEYAYGEAGSPPKIPPNSTLVFDVKLLDVEEEKPKEKDKWDSTDEERIVKAQGFKD